MMTNVYVNGIKTETDVPKDYIHLFENAKFSTAVQLRTAIRYAKHATELFYSGLLTKNQKAVIESNKYEAMFKKIIEDCRDEAILEEYADCYDLRNDISTYEMEVA